MKPFRNGQEAQSGTIRRDPAWLRGRRDDSRAGDKAQGASPDGAAGDRQRDPASEKLNQRILRFLPYPFKLKWHQSLSIQIHEQIMVLLVST
jgi:hypothetical protein